MTESRIVIPPTKRKPVSVKAFELVDGVQMFLRSKAVLDCRNPAYLWHDAGKFERYSQIAFNETFSAIDANLMYRQKLWFLFGDERNEPVSKKIASSTSIGHGPFRLFFFLVGRPGPHWLEFLDIGTSTEAGAVEVTVMTDRSLSFETLWGMSFSPKDCSEESAIR